MHQPDRQSPTQQPLGFDYEEGHAEQGLTGLAGIPVLVQAFRSLDLPRRVAIRIRKRQGELFADGAEAKHFAVVSNVWEWETKRLLEWHREKAGTIEALHDVLKNELAARVLPCSCFGANAAWLRLAVLTHNVITVLPR